MRLINFRGYFINPNNINYISYISDVYVVNFPKIWAFTIYFMSDKKLEIYSYEEEEIKQIRMDLFDLINTREIW